MLGAPGAPFEPGLCPLTLLRAGLEEPEATLFYAWLSPIFPGKGLGSGASRGEGTGWCSLSSATSHRETTGKTLAKRAKRSIKPAKAPAVMDHSTQVGA